MQAMAAVLGGCQSLHTNGRTSALAADRSERAHRAADAADRRAESGSAIHRPLGGSWGGGVAHRRLEARADDYLKKIEEMGGMVEAISRQYPQREIEEAAYVAQKAVEDKKQIVVGVKTSPSRASRRDTLRIDPRLEEQQVARVRHSGGSGTDRRPQGPVESQGCPEGTRTCAADRGGGEGAGDAGGDRDAMREVFGEH